MLCQVKFSLALTNPGWSHLRMCEIIPMVVLLLVFAKFLVLFWTSYWTPISCQLLKRNASKENGRKLICPQWRCDSYSWICGSRSQAVCLLMHATPLFWQCSWCDVIHHRQWKKIIHQRNISHTNTDNQLILYDSDELEIRQSCYPLLSFFIRICHKLLHSQQPA